MTESASPSPVATPAAAEDAGAAALRRRKARREAKIRAGGADRLNKITGLGGGLKRDVPPPKAEVADPDEVDISEHYYQPNVTPRTGAAGAAAGGSAGSGADVDAQLRQLLLAQQQGAGQEPPMMNPFGANDPFGFGSMSMGGGGADDPMMAMMSQMMQAMGGAGGAGGPGGPGMGMPGMPGMDGFPGFPGMADMMGQQQQQQQQAKSAIPRTPAALWRLVHFAVAISLGLYVALSTSFKGTLEERQLADAADAAVAAAAAAGGSSSGHQFGDEFAEQKRYFFYAFATAETVLLTSRIFLERRWAGSAFGSSSGGGGAGGGLVGMAMGFLPPTVKRNVDIAMQYWQIFSTVRNDLLVCIFVLGVYSWWRS